ncbi:MAG: twin-arginine translocase subunit TatC [Methylococcales bacterium]|nr:twin-arginine translocase subunit TatC [Methylococcales bacterium]
MYKAILSIWHATRRILRTIFNIISSPYKGFIRFQEYLNTEPEERSNSDTLLDRLTLGANARFRIPPEMWKEALKLRIHLIRITGIFIIACALAFLFITEIMFILQNPLIQIENLRLSISSPDSAFDIIPQIVFSSAFIFSLPYMIFELWLFVSPALRPREKKLGLILAFIFIILSTTAIAMAYYIILPVSLTAALSLTSKFGVFDWDLIGYLSFSLKIMILSAIVVYYPFGIYLYSVKFQKSRIPLRIIFLISFFIAALITPGTMILIDFGLTIVLFFIYLPTYLAIKLIYRTPE